MPVAVSPRKRHPLRKLAWLVILVLALAVSSELVLRFILGLGNPVVIAPDSACSYVVAPNQHAWRFFCHTRIDSHGMRSDEFSPTPPPGTLRVMFVGDSVTYGTTHIDQSRIFTQVLRRGLPSVIHRSVEVLNASADGWAIDNELSWLRSRGAFHANLVVLVLNSGDLGQPRADIRDSSDRTAQNHPQTGFGELWARWLKPRLFHSPPHTDAGDSARQNAHATIRANLADLDEFQTLAEADGARMVILYIPFRKEIPSPASDSEARLSAWTTAHRVPFFDMTPVEAHYAVRDIAPDGDHLSVLGNRIIAEAVEQNWNSALNR